MYSKVECNFGIYQVNLGSSRQSSRGVGSSVLGLSLYNMPVSTETFLLLFT